MVVICFISCLMSLKSQVQDPLAGPMRGRWSKYKVLGPVGLEGTCQAAESNWWGGGGGGGGSFPSSSFLDLRMGGQAGGQPAWLCSCWRLCPLTHSLFIWAVPNTVGRWVAPMLLSPEEQGGRLEAGELPSFPRHAAYALGPLGQAGLRLGLCRPGEW